MKTLNEIRSALSNFSRDTFNTKEAAIIMGTTTGAISGYLYLHRELAPQLVKGVKSKEYRWTSEDIIRYSEHKIAYGRTKIAKTTSAPVEHPAPITATPESASAEYISPIDTLIAIDKTISENPNVRVYYDMRNKFEQMNEAALQKLFAPLLERFKFSYICKCIPEIQSQMLTCINKGKLRGMDKYKLDFNAFLKLIKFAHDNCVPLDAVDDQKGEN